MADQETLAVYDAKADDYAALTPDPDEVKTLTAFLDCFEPGARVLDFGCGPGHYAAAMAQSGLNVDAFDASEEMVALATAQPGVTAWQATFDELSAEAVYDGLWANFSLLHAPRTEMPSHLARM